MTIHRFECIDAHTCGNPVRVVIDGGPNLTGATMSERRQHFIRDYDWIRRALMFEPRGHDMMSGSILYPPISGDSDAAILYIETSGCLPMCGHGTIGTVTVAIEQGLITPKVEEKVTLDAPAGRITADYETEGSSVKSVRFHNVPSFLYQREIEVECPGLGALTMDIAYGGNFYAIIEPQANYPGLDGFSAADILRFSPLARNAVNEAIEAVHPNDPTITKISHLMWTGTAKQPDSDGRNAVFYGDHAIDRSPCGTGTSARLAQLVARGDLAMGETFVHESIIGSQFTAVASPAENVGPFAAITPSIEGWAKVTGFNTIIVDESDPYAHGFQVL